MRQIEEIAQLGVPFKRQQVPSVAPLNVRQQPMQQRTEKTVVDRPRNTPPSVHIVRQQHPVAPRNPAPFETILDTLVQENQKPRSGHAFASDSKSKEQLEQEKREQQLAQQPSTLFSDSVEEINAALQRNNNQQVDATLEQIVSNRPKRVIQPSVEPLVYKE